MLSMKRGQATFGRKWNIDYIDYIDYKESSLSPFLAFTIAFFILIFPQNSFPQALSKPIPHGLHKKFLQHDGLKRSYSLYIPSSYDGKRPAPVLIALHGGLGSTIGMITLTKGGLNILARQEGFLVVYPEGIDRHWNDGRGVNRYRTQRENIDDVGFIAALIDQLTKEFAIDSKRIYVTGASNGGLMTYRLGCELSEKIAAIAPVIAGMPENLVSQCSPSRPIPVMIINSKDDPLVPWDGGYIHFGQQTLGKILSTQESIEYWARHNGCLFPMVTERELNKDAKDGTKVIIQEYNGCDDATEVILYTIEGGGHTWPGGWQYFPEKIIGKTSREIDANEVIWKFFKRHALP